MEVEIVELSGLVTGIGNFLLQKFSKERLPFLPNMVRSSTTIYAAISSWRVRQGSSKSSLTGAVSGLDFCAARVTSGSNPGVWHLNGLYLKEAF